MSDKPKIERAPANKIKIALEQIVEIDEAIQADLINTPDFVLKFMGGDPQKNSDGMMDRFEAFGEDIFLSLKQCETINNIHLQLVLGEKPKPKTPVKPNRYTQE